jgi:hypothetical protein
MISKKASTQEPDSKIAPSRTKKDLPVRLAALGLAAFAVSYLDFAYATVVQNGGTRRAAGHGLDSRQ